MKSLDKKEVDSLIGQVSQAHGVSPAEVRKEMETVIDMAMDSDDPMARANMIALIGHEGRPTLGEFIAALASATMPGKQTDGQ